MNAQGSQESRVARTEAEVKDVTVQPVAELRMKPVERDNLQQQSYLALREALMKGRFMPGDTVSLRNLASELGTSPMPVREAVQHLIAEGALVLRPNRTFAVADMTQEILAEIQSLRVLLEGTATEAAVPNMGMQELKHLHGLQDRMREALGKGDTKDYLTTNQDFHFSIYARSNHHITLQIIENLWLRIGPSFNLLVRGERVSQRDEASIASLTHYHEAALTAIAAGRPADARRAIESDIREGMQFISESLPELTGGSTPARGKAWRRGPRPSMGQDTR